MATETVSATGMASPPPGNGISYDGQAGPLFRLGLRVAALTLLTLGIYRFWGKTEIRRRLWSRVRLGADRFEYTGTGKELFLGFLIVLAVLIPLGIVFQTLGVLSVAWSPAAQAAVSVAQTVIFLYLIGYAIYRARRYRLSRTLLRGIRFGQDGSAVRYGLRFLGYMLLTGITLGVAKPVGDVRLYRFQTTNTTFGDRSFDYDGTPGEMMGRWVLCIVIAPFTLGVSLLWYSAFKIRYFAAGTSFMGLGFALPVNFGDLIRIYVPYVLASVALFVIPLLVVIGIGFSFPHPDIRDPEAFGTWAGNWAAIGGAVTILVFALFNPILSLMLVTHRFLKLSAERLQITGDVDIESVLQSAPARSGAAEGMADALDVGAGVEVGF